MAEGTVQLPVDSSGSKVRTETAVVGGNTVHQQVVTLADSDGTLVTPSVLGATADAAVSTDTTGSLSGKLRGLVKLLASAIGTAGSSATGVLSVQGIASGTAQPVSISAGNVPSENTYLTSSGRTTTQTQGDQTNSSAYRGVHVIVDVTDVSASPSITPEIDAKDPVSGKYYALLSGSAITTTGTTVLKVFPGASPQANGVANDILPKTWRIKVTANNANSGTYSVGYVLVP